MGIFSRLFGGEAKSETTSSDRPSSWFLDWATGGAASLSGIRVSPDSAMRLSAVWACVRVRSEDIGKLPCHLYRRLPNGGKERATDHPVYRLVMDRPNPLQTAFEFRQMLQAQLDLRGNAYALKDFDGRGRVTALWPLRSECVTVLVTPDGRDLFYRVQHRRGDIETYPAEAIMHLRGLTLDGYVGLSPIGYHRETIGLAVAAEKYGAAFFGNSAQPRGVVKVPTIVNKDAADRLRADWESKYRGVENSNRIAIFDGGMEFVQTGMDHADAQYIEIRKMQDQQIYKLYRMPPHKVGDLDKATNNNIEHQGLEYVTDCLLSEMIRWEKTLKRDLLSDAEQAEYFFEFLPDALLRGDIKSRFEAYAIARNWGVFCVDDIRERENMNHLPDNKGQIYLQPLNMIEAGTTPPSPGGAKELLALAYHLVAREDARNAEED